MDIMPLASTQSLSQAGKSEEMKLKEAAQAFEGYFVYTLMKEMQKTSGKLFGSGPGGGIYEHFFQQAMADKITASGGFGLTPYLMRSLEQRGKPVDPNALPREGEGFPLVKKRVLPLQNEAFPLSPKPVSPFGEKTRPLNLLRGLTDKLSEEQNYGAGVSLKI